MKAAMYNFTTNKVIKYKNTDALVKALKRYAKWGYIPASASVLYVAGHELQWVGIVRKDADWKLGPRTSQTPGWQGISPYTGNVYYNNKIIQRPTE